MTTTDFGGATGQSFTYDNLYQLTHAEGDWEEKGGKDERYTLDMSYDTIGNIQTKNQVHDRLINGSDWTPATGTNYNWSYIYDSSHPHAPTTIGKRTFTYDLNGNQLGWTNPENDSYRKIQWDEENRIQSINDNSETSYYLYDDKGYAVKS